MILHSRQSPSPEKFVNAFLNTLTPFMMPTTDWQMIDIDIQIYQPALTYLKRFPDTDLTTLIEQAPEPLRVIQTAFALLGYEQIGWRRDHDDDFMLAIEDRISNGDIATIERICEVLSAQGLPQLLQRGTLDSLLLGNLLRHYRHLDYYADANAFDENITAIIDSVCEALSLTHQRASFRLADYNTSFEHVLFRGKRPLVAVSKTFSGVSAPTIESEKMLLLREKGVLYITFMDGGGLYEMADALADAYRQNANIYNVHQAERYLLDDLRRYL